MAVTIPELTDFLSHDADMGVVLINDQFIIKDLSDSASAILEQSFNDLIEQDMRRVLPFMFDNQWLRAGSIRMHCNKHLHIGSLPFPENNLQMVLIRDITKNIMHDIYLRVINFVNHSVVISDETGHILRINDAAIKSEGRINKNVVGRHLSEVYTLFEDSEYLTIRAINSKKSHINIRQIYATDQGKMLDSLVSTYPIIIDDRIFGAVCIMEDYGKIDTLTKKILELQSLLSNAPKKGSIKNELVAKYTFNDIVSRNPRMVNCIKKCKLAAKNDSSVLIYGATGTGKELFAQSIHNHSKRADKPFIAINCAAIPNNLLEGMLFGTVKGAYTGAENRAGLLEQAHGGTLLLDEINSMAISLQAKLLRVLQDGYIRRLGSNTEQRVDVRIISNINRPPQEEISRGMLRQDLFYRLGAVCINIPLLSERTNDIELLAKQFILDFNEKMGKNVMDISEDTAELFRNYAWPGNVRELQHAIEHAMNIMPDDKVLIRPRYLPESITAANGRQSGYINASPDKTGRGANIPEREMIIQALKHNQGNITHTARWLGISRQNLQYRLKKHNISRHV